MQRSQAIRSQPSSSLNSARARQLKRIVGRQVIQVRGKKYQIPQRGVSNSAKLMAREPGLGKSGCRASVGDSAPARVVTVSFVIQTADSGGGSGPCGISPPTQKRLTAIFNTASFKGTSSNSRQPGWDKAHTYSQLPKLQYQRALRKFRGLVTKEKLIGHLEKRGFVLLSGGSTGGSTIYGRRITIRTKDQDGKIIKEETKIEMIRIDHGENKERTPSKKIPEEVRNDPQKLSAYLQREDKAKRQQHLAMPDSASPTKQLSGMAAGTKFKGDFNHWHHEIIPDDHELFGRYLKPPPPEGKRDLWDWRLQDSVERFDAMGHKVPPTASRPYVPPKPEITSPFNKAAGGSNEPVDSGGGFGDGGEGGGKGEGAASAPNGQSTIKRFNENKSDIAQPSNKESSSGIAAGQSDRSGVGTKSGLVSPVGPLKDRFGKASEGLPHKGGGSGGGDDVPELRPPSPLDGNGGLAGTSRKTPGVLKPQ